MKLRIPIVLSLAAALLGSAGCHAQVPPASKGYNVNLTWTAPAAGSGWAGCTVAAPCTYTVYRDAVASGAACDPTTSANWKQVGTAAGAAYTDGTATGLNACYSVETLQASASSGPSNMVQFQVPGVPLAPSLAAPASTQQSLLEPQLQSIPPRNSAMAALVIHAELVAARRE